MANPQLAATANLLVTWPSKDGVGFDVRLTLQLCESAGAPVMEVMDQQALAGVMDPGSPRFFFFGGGRKGQEKREIKERFGFNMRHGGQMSIRFQTGGASSTS